MIETTAPQSDELEVSLFGPGVGECAVVHLGDGRWMVVDSCSDSDSSKPAALTYLNSLGVSPDAVDLIVISHWHDDHIGGAAELVEACTNARIAYSSAFRQSEFLALIDTFASSTSFLDYDKPQTKEINKIMKIMDARPDERPVDKLASRRAASSDRILFERRIGMPVMEVRALSPSDFAVNNALIEASELIPQKNGERRVLIRPKQNRGSVALWVTVGQQSALLGADLEQENNPYIGWTAIVNEHQLGKAKVFKVPHHGSVNGHNEDVWKEMLEGQPIAMLTEYTPSMLPREEDVARIKSYANYVYCTTRGKRRLPKRDRAIDRTMKEVCRQRSPIRKPLGHVQLRIGQSGEIQVNLNAQAQAL